MPSHRLLVLALASALAATPALAQNPPAPQPAPPPAPQPAPQDKDKADKPRDQLEQDALDPAGNDPARASAQTAKGASKPGEAKDEKKWDVSAAHGPTKSVRFETDEGTWMDVDGSPDGREVAFSLLGDLYRLPIAGGAAQRVTSGPAWDVQPRWSPDGRELAFTSDRGGASAATAATRCR